MYKPKAYLPALVLALALLAGCAPQASSSVAASSQSAAGAPAESATGATGSQTEEAMQTVTFTASYARIGGWSSSYENPHTEQFYSVEELQQFYEQNNDAMTLDISYSGDTFADRMNSYDAAYFEENVLLVLFAMASSGSDTIEVSRVARQGDALVVEAGRHKPGAGMLGTDDMAFWAVFIEVAKADMAQEVRAVLE